jgi:gamma-glutamyltranspeptidase/glutathione hydrolase
MLRLLRTTLSLTFILVITVIHLPDVLSSPVEGLARHDSRRASAIRTIEEGKLGAVASESAICSRHGTEILKLGGNAADAVSDNELLRFW